LIVRIQRYKYPLYKDTSIEGSKDRSMKGRKIQYKNVKIKGYKDPMIQE